MNNEPIVDIVDIYPDSREITTRELEVGMKLTDIHGARHTITKTVHFKTGVRVYRDDENVFTGKPYAEWFDYRDVDGNEKPIVIF